MAVQTTNNLITSIGTTPVVVAQTDAGTRATILGLSLTNLLEQFIYVDIIMNDGVNEAYYLKNCILPPKTSLRAVSTGEKLILGLSNNLTVKSSIDDSIDAIVSLAELT